MTKLHSSPVKRAEIHRLRANKNKVECDYSTVFKQGDLYYYLDSDGKAHGPFQTIDETESVINISPSK